MGTLLPTIHATLPSAIALLDSPLVHALLGTHPNDVGSWASETERPYPFAEDWWTGWVAGRYEDVDELGQDVLGQSRTQPWVQVLSYYLRQQNKKSKEDADDEDIPGPLRTLIDSLVALSLPRACSVGTPAKVSTVGLSPKKVHEVSQCISYMAELLPSLPGLQAPTPTLRIVDVGSGQGYLTRALQTHLRASRPDIDTQFLALDSNEVQTAGASRWDTRIEPEGRITQKTIHITPETLLSAVDDWTTDDEFNPVLFVALHACGSLTPDIFRAFFARRQQQQQQGGRWKPIGVLAVGCCYNLLAPRGKFLLLPVTFSISEMLRRSIHSILATRRKAFARVDIAGFLTTFLPINIPRPYHLSDFPLSQYVQSLSPALAQRLPGSAYHLAAQMPAEWTRSPGAWRDAKLAVKKVVWRAVVGGRIARMTQEEVVESISISTPATRDRLSAAPGGLPGQGSGDKPAMRRLGRLNDAVYNDWPGFVRTASDKLCGDQHLEGDLTTEEHTLINELGVLHVLRCIVGPLVESVIVGDRAVWVEEQVQAHRLREDPDQLDSELGIEAINLFDQSTGSGRNIALVLH
ncbi:methyltransferase domain-containing protein [Mycena amicta]|nr:methyltransferase domain-containing protein [Mycena amicta]